MIPVVRVLDATRKILADAGTSIGRSGIPAAIKLLQSRQECRSYLKICTCLFIAAPATQSPDFAGVAAQRVLWFQVRNGTVLFTLENVFPLDTLGSGWYKFLFRKNPQTQ